MLFGFLILSALVGHLYALSVPSSPSVILPTQPDTLGSRPNTNPTKRQEWPSTPFMVPYHHNKYTLGFIAYASEPYNRETLSIQVNAGLDLMICNILRLRREEFTPSDPPIFVEKGIVQFHLGFLEIVSTISLALALQAIRDLMQFDFWPREIVTAEFEKREPWDLMARFSLKFRR